MDKINLTETEKTKITSYLTSPTSKGIYVLQMELNDQSPIVQKVVDYLKKEDAKEKIYFDPIDQNFATEINEPENLLLLLRRIFQSKKQKEPLEARTYVMYRVFALLEGEQGKRLFNEFETYRNKFDELISNLSFDVIHNEYTDAKDPRRLSFYYLDDAVAFAIKDGNKITLYSVNKSILNRIKEFFEYIESIEVGGEVETKFSPDVELFKPYFYFFSLVYKKVIKDEFARDLLDESFDQFNRGKNNYSISNIGLATEDLLIQIYESVLRNECPRTFTSGQIVKALEARVRTIEAGVQKMNEKENILLKRIKSQIKDSRKTGRKDILVICKDIVEQQKLFKSDVYKLIDALEENKGEKSLFPRDLRNKVAELIEFRNASSHKSNTKLSSLDAQRSIYYYFSLYQWWIERCHLIDPEKDIKDTIAELTQ